MPKIAFIGSGHIGEILVHNFTQMNDVAPSDICVTDPDSPKMSRLADMFGVNTAPSNAAAAAWGDYIFICVHPNAVPSIIEDLRGIPGKTIVSVTAGTSTETYRAALDARVVRILPNPPSRLGQGAVPVVADSRMDVSEKEALMGLLSSLGPCFFVPERAVDIFTSVTSPAPVLAFFDAMIDAAVYCGLDYTTSCQMVKQTIKGCLALWDEKDLPHLITEACTPGGTSVESLRTLDRGAFRSTVKEAYIGAYEKSRKLGSQ